MLEEARREPDDPPALGREVGVPVAVVLEGLPVTVPREAVGLEAEAQVGEGEVERGATPVAEGDPEVGGVGEGEGAGAVVLVQVPLGLRPGQVAGIVQQRPPQSVARPAAGELERRPEVGERAGLAAQCLVDGVAALVGDEVEDGQGRVRQGEPAAVDDEVAGDVTLLPTEPRDRDQAAWPRRRQDVGGQLGPPRQAGGGSTRDDGVGVEVLQGCGPELQGDGGRGRGVDGGQHLDQVAAPERPACPSLVSA